MNVYVINGKTNFPASIILERIKHVNSLRILLPTSYYYGIYKHNFVLSIDQQVKFVSIILLDFLLYEDSPQWNL
jgi:hypothetical protein